MVKTNNEINDVYLKRFVCTLQPARIIIVKTDIGN